MLGVFFCFMLQFVQKPFSLRNYLLKMLKKVKNRHILANFQYIYPLLNANNE